MKNSKHYFAAAITGSGVCQFFDQINDDSKPGMLYIIKGGPGTGKSTMMKKIGQRFLEEGEEIEFFHCSSDPSSLDGVRLKKRNIAIVDGTAPHAMEPKFPAIKERIVNLEEFILPNVSKFEKAIRKAATKKKQYYQIMFSLIGAAERLYQCNVEMDRNVVLEEDIKKTAATIFEGLKPVKQNKNALPRKLFLKTVNGIDFEQENCYKKALEVAGNSCSAPQILRQIGEFFLETGYDLIHFCEPLSPEQIIGCYVEKLNYFFYANTDSSSHPQKSIYEFNKKTINALTKKADDALKLAQIEHKKIESFYVQNMDFEKLSKRTELLFNEIKNCFRS